MAASAGRSLRIKYNDGTGAVVITGSTQDGFTITKDGIDVTDKDDSAIQTMISDAVGRWAMEGNIEGVLKNTTLLDLANDNTTFSYDFEIDVAGLGSYTGTFGITNFQVTGPEGAEYVGFTCSLASTGPVTFTAA